MLYNAHDLVLRHSTVLKSECNKSQSTYLLILSRSQLHKFSGLRIRTMSALQQMVLFGNSNPGGVSRIKAEWNFLQDQNDSLLDVYGDNQS